MESYSHYALKNGEMKRVKNKRSYRTAKNVYTVDKYKTHTIYFEIEPDKDNLPSYQKTIMGLVIFRDYDHDKKKYKEDEVFVKFDEWDDEFSFGEGEDRIKINLPFYVVLDRITKNYESLKKIKCFQDCWDILLKELK